MDDATEDRQALLTLAAERRWWAALVHDKVLGALQLAARGEEPEARASARSLAAEALTALAEHAASGVGGGGGDDRDTERDAADDLAAVGRRLGLPLTMSVRTGPCPPRVFDTVLLAAGEALSNAAKHARAHAVTVLGHLGPDVDLTITDDGRGFDPDAVDPARLGVRRSLGERMAGIGGAAVVLSQVGAGTTVRLTAPASEAASGLEWFEERERRRQLAALQRDVIPVLELIAGPEPLPEAVRASCLPLEAAARDRLSASPLIDDQIAAALAVARGDGARVSLSTAGSGGDPVEYVAVKHWLRMLLRRAGRGSRLTVRWRGGAGSAFATLTLVGAGPGGADGVPPSDAAVGGVGAEVDDDEDWLMVTLRHPGLPAVLPATAARGPNLLED